MSQPFQIEFDYSIEGLPTSFRLTALVDLHPTGIYYITDIKNDHQKQVLPVQSIKKVKDKWVHKDSEKDTYLSEAIGKAIDVTKLRG